MIRLLVIIPNMSSHGCERIVSYILKYLDRNIFTIDLLMGENKIDFEIPEDVNTHILNVDTSPKHLFIFKIIRFFKKIYKTGKFLRHNNYNVIISFIDVNNAQTFLACKIFNIKTPLILAEYTVSERFFEKNIYANKRVRLLKFLLSFSYNRADKVIVISEAMKKYLRDAMKVKNNISVIYSGVDIEAADRDDKSQIEKEFLKAPVKIINVGGLDENKNQSLLIDAFELLLKKKPDASLFIIGTGEKEAHLREKIKELGLERKVFLLGWKKDIFAYMKMADLLVHVSKYESFGNVLVEAMIYGAPVVTTFSTGALLEILDNGKYGNIVYNYEPEKIAEAMFDSLQNPQKQEIKDYTRKKFDIKETVKQYSEIILSTRKESPNKHKIAFLISSLENGGTERFIVNLLEGVNKDDFDVSLLLGQAKGEYLNILPPHIEVVNLNSKNIFSIILRLNKYLKIKKPDILFSVFPKLNLAATITKTNFRTKTKIIISERSTLSQIASSSATKFSHKFIARFFLGALVKIFYRKADAIVCVSNGVKDDLAKIIGDLPTLKVIYNPVINGDFYKLSQEPIEDERFLNSSLPKVLAVGRLTKAKDYLTMLRAFSLALSKNPLNLFIIGEGEERKKIEGIIRELNLEKNVFLLGSQKNPFKYMAKADIFILSSILEGFPNVLVEAMACGAPVISTDCQSGPNEIIENGKSGILASVRDEKALADAIIKLLNDVNLKSRFSMNGKEQSKKFTAAKSVPEYEKLFKEIIER
ncbi:MAG: glycosyltransferase [Candidatus Pacebacteria bacterium]|nr:glycosyltransferase [Candidatus Paceibacterota bacterium]